MIRTSFRTRLASLAASTLFTMTSSAFAATVSMPTSTGTIELDSSAFALSILGGPSGEFGCFSGGHVSACTQATLQSAVLGPDLTTGLVLGQGGTITLALPARGSTILIWEAGSQGTTDIGSSLVSVHTAAGWSTEHAYAAGHALPVLNDTQPSGYPTNFGVFQSGDFGIESSALIDAVRIRSCCGSAAHADILAVATAVPEPSTLALAVPGLAGMAIWRRLRRRQD